MTIDSDVKRPEYTQPPFPESQSCGTCAWFTLTGIKYWGTCSPQIPMPYWVLIYDTPTRAEHTGCPCWRQREKGAKA